jgi:hypothetical protein
MKAVTDKMRTIFGILSTSFDNLEKMQPQDHPEEFGRLLMAIPSKVASADHVEGW